jgi:hypothetical protein
VLGGQIAFAASLALAIGVAVFVLVKRRRRPSRALLVALAHPGLWWPTSRDCGWSLRILTFAGSLAVVLAALFALWRARER